MSTIKTETLSTPSNSTVPVDTVVNGTAKAWVNFNGTGTPAIRNSHNVSSITDVSVGKQKTNFTNQMANDQYSVSGTANWRGCVCGNDYDINYLETITGTFGGADAGADDYAYVHYSIFGD